MSENQDLVNIVRAVILKQQQQREASVSRFWNNVHAGAFATAYKKLPPTSENVWCCMSNGNYDNPKKAIVNISESAGICASSDSRVDPAIVPVAFEVALFAPRSLWLALGNGEEAIHKMRRRLHRALMVENRDGSSAVYLPDVWNQYEQWSAADLLQHLSKKASTSMSSGLDDIAQVYEIPCFAAADPSIPIEMHDRGFFATLILERAWQFYEFYRKGNQLAYLVNNSTGKTHYENEGATVRSFADVSAYCKLAQLLDKPYNKVLMYALNEFVRNDAASLAAYISLVIETEQTLDAADVANLVSSNVSDMAFVKPQVVIALAHAYKFLNGRAHLQLREDLVAAVLQYCNDVAAIRAAMEEHGAFAANWYLQAIAAIESTSWACLSILCKQLCSSVDKNKAILFEYAVDLCIKALQNKVSITEEACAAHGLVVSGKFDFSLHDAMAETWARFQYGWNSHSHGGFRYYVDKPWYRTDVASHVVEVALLLRERKDRKAHGPLRPVSCGNCGFVDPANVAKL